MTKNELILLTPVKAIHTLINRRSCSLQRRHANSQMMLANVLLSRLLQQLLTHCWMLKICWITFAIPSEALQLVTPAATECNQIVESTSQQVLHALININSDKIDGANCPLRIEIMGEVHRIFGYMFSFFEVYFLHRYSLPPAVWWTCFFHIIWCECFHC